MITTAKAYEIKRFFPALGLKFVVHVLSVISFNQHFASHFGFVPDTITSDSFENTFNNTLK